MNYSEFHSLVTKSRTVHQFDPQESISSEDLFEVIETSLLAPNHKLTFPWNILIVGSEKREKISLVAMKLAASKGGDEDAQEKSRLKALGASALLVMVQEKKPHNPFEQREDYATLACSIQLMALGFQLKGFHYKWSTGAISQNEETYKILGVDAAKEEIVGFIWVGKPLKGPTVKPRPSVKEVVRQV
ncbi:MAG: nitroreductase family protein [Halobacteriovoraceae bacterium]|nr:nitroreductase family protein [Halobacteriovoraceae bacterium]